MNRLNAWIDRARRLWSNKRGNVIVEFAIGSLLMVVVFTGTYEYGYTFLQYNTLENAVIRGARYASLVPYDSATDTPTTAFSTAVKNMVVYGTPSAGTSPVVNGLSTSNVTLTVTFSNLIPASMTVKINTFTVSAFFGSTTLNNKPTVTYAYQGIWAPE